MTGRRVPLSSNPNAVNSPYRSVAAAASKQKRSYANIQREDAYGQPPPAKKQMLEAHQVLRTPPRQQSTQSSFEGRVFTRRSNGANPTAFERECVSARDRSSQQTAAKPEKALGDNLETIRNWQKHYKKIFPTFVFYFESISEDIRLKYTKQVIALGAREEKFFSRAVTHVVTTRSIPALQETESAVSSSTITDSQSQNSQPQTINPSLLDRSSESTNVPSDLGSKAKFTFDAPINRRLAANVHEGDSRRQQARSSDVLHKARSLGMKIWQLEKLQRIMNVMFDTEPGYQAHSHNTRSNSVSTTIPRTAREADLSQLLRNERLNGPSDRDPTVATKEMVLFKGLYLYIHDVDEKQKPIMFREYSKVANKEDGDWPQFRSVANGKCPFVDDTDSSKREAEKEKEFLRIQRQQEKEQAMAPRTRAASAVEASKMHPPRTMKDKRTLSEVFHANKNAAIPARPSNMFAPTKHTYSQRLDQDPSSRGNAFVTRGGAGAGRLFAGEPVASGLQQSNITSAIRSTVTSSTAAQPSNKTGTSKELHGLQRKVLERNSGGAGSYGLASSHRMTDLSTAARDDAATQSLKRRGQHKLAYVEEDTDQTNSKNEVTHKSKSVSQKKTEKRDPKAGYCENCLDKFEDFEEHSMTKKHRRFAEKSENWKELDQLLSQLCRPLRNDSDDY